MGVTGAHFVDLKPGTKNAMVLNWVYDPRRVSPVRDGYFAGPSIEDASVITVNAGIQFNGPFQPNGGSPRLVDLFAKVEWSSGGKDYQSCEFDVVRGSAISFAAARATVSASYVLASGVDPASMPTATVNITLGRLPSGKRAHRTLYAGPVAPGASATLRIPNFAESMIVHSNQIPLVARVDQYVANALVASQNVTSSLPTDVVTLSGIADTVVLTNNGAANARLSAQYLLTL